MAIQVDQPFELKNKEALDIRTHFKTLQEMKDYDEAFLPETFYAVNDETGKIYIYNKNNTDDPDTGKWREIQGKGTGNVDTMTVSEFNTYWDNLEVSAAGYQPPTP